MWRRTKKRKLLLLYTSILRHGWHARFVPEGPVLMITVNNTSTKVEDIIHFKLIFRNGIEPKQVNAYVLLLTLLLLHAVRGWVQRKQRIGNAITTCKSRFYNINATIGSIIFMVF